MSNCCCLSTLGLNTWSKDAGGCTNPYPLLIFLLHLLHTPVAETTTPELPYNTPLLLFHPPPRPVKMIESESVRRKRRGKKRKSDNIRSPNRKKKVGGVKPIWFKLRPPTAVYSSSSNLGNQYSLLHPPSFLLLLYPWRHSHFLSPLPPLLFPFGK